MLHQRHCGPQQSHGARGGSSIRDFPLALLSTIYGLLVRSRYQLYGWGIFPTQKLPAKVVCVGNMTMGGTGKTPMVEYTARTLRDLGMRVAVLSRGYKGKMEKSVGVVSDGKNILLSQEESGDEPYLLAHRLEGIPVLVGGGRFRSGMMAHEHFDIQVAVLDDGYQHVQLHRDMNILLVNGREGFGNGHLLPWGCLREPLTGLTRADHFLITKTELRDKTEAIEKTLRHWNSKAPIFHGRYVPEHICDPQSGRRDRPVAIKGKRILAFAGLADPDDFFELLRSLGAVLVETIIFPDHHRYTESDLKILGQKIPGVDWVLTTEKDMVRLQSLNLEGLPIRVLTIRMEIADEDALREALFTGLSGPEAAA